MSSKDTKILEFNQYRKSDKAPFNINADLDCLIEKIDGCDNNPENSFTAKVGEHIPSGFSMSTISTFKSIEKTFGAYTEYTEVKTAYKQFCKFLREHAMEIIKFKKKKMNSLTNEQQKLYQNANIYYICE